MFMLEQRAVRHHFEGLIRAVTLDIAGVLVLPNHALILPDASPDENWDAVFFSMSIQQDSQYDDVDWKAVGAEVGAEEERVKDYVQQLQARHTSPSIWRAAPGAVDFVSWLRSMEIPIAAISNTLQPTALEVLERAGFIGPQGLSADRVFDSSIVGIAKPDPRLFHVAFDSLRVPASEVAHIGDSLKDDVEGAALAGAVGVHMRPFRRCTIADHIDIFEFSDFNLRREQLR